MRRLFLAFSLPLLLASSLAAAQTEYTFTTAGATGTTGPDQAAIDAAYSGTNLDGDVTSTGGIQSWVVPQTGFYRIEAFGAQGYGTFGGRGARIAGEFALTAGDTLKILVGQAAPPYLNFPATTYNNQYGGGGGSFVTLDDNTPLLVAGGGGGSHAASFLPGADGQITEAGAAGAEGAIVGAGGTAGQGGQQASSADGGGGLLGNGAGIAGGQAFVNGGAGGSDEGFGGFGGGGGTSSWNNYRGGGGGGYSGGGGGNNNSSTSCCAAGGGGGSFNDGDNPVNEAGIQEGDGLVRLTLLADVQLSQDGSPVANGGSYDFGQQLINQDVDVVFTLANYGDAALNLTTPLAVTGANQADFTVTSQPATTVAASGGTTTFTVRFTPAEAGARTAALSIVHDNSDESPFEFDLAGEGLSPSFSGITVPGTGTGVEATASVSGASCGFTSAGFAALSSIAEEPPENLQFNNGLFAFELSNCDPGGTASVSIDYGSVLPAGLEYWKYGPTAENTDPHWYRLPAVVAGSTVTFEVVDGGPGDQDLTANGTITDPGGPAEFFIEPVPVLSPAFLAIVTGLLALLAMLALSRNGLLGRVTPRSR